jgi:hypothetical protein
LEINPPEDKGLMRLRRINSPPLGAIMDITIDTQLLCGGVVHLSLSRKGINQVYEGYYSAW